MKKFIQLSLAAILGLSACAPAQGPKTVKNINEAELAKIRADQDAITFWKDVTVGDRPNLALGELLKNLMSPEAKKLLPTTLVKNSALFLQELGQERDVLKRELILRNIPYARDYNILNGSVLWTTDHRNFTSLDFVQGFDWAMQREKQSRAIKAIQESFRKRSEEIAVQITPAILKSLTPQDLKKINSAPGTTEEKAAVILATLTRYDKILSAYNFNAEDGTRLTLLTIVAGVLAKELENNKSVQAFLAQVEDVTKTVALVKEVVGIIQIVETNRLKMKSDWNDMKSSMDALVKDAKVAKDKFRQEDFLRAESRVEIYRLLHDSVASTIEPGEGGSFLTTGTVNPNVDKFVTSAASASDHLGNILNATDAITAKLGIQLDPGVTKVLSTARDISQGVQLAKTVMLAYASGGLLGAVGAFGAGGGGSILGMGGDPLAGEIKAMKKDLEEIKKLQRQMIELQVETMKMVQNLASLIEKNHEEQMVLLTKISAQSDVLIAVQSFATHKNLKSCQSMLDFLYNDKSAEAEKFSQVHLLALPRSTAFSRVNNTAGLLEFVHSTSQNVFTDCQSGIDDAFGQRTGASSPLNLKANVSSSDLGPNIEAKYLPLLAFVGKNVTHIPSANFATLKRKQSYDSNISKDLRLNYDLQNVISVEALEKYIVPLLILSPWVSFDKEVWTNFDDGNKLRSAYDISWGRTQNWLHNALYLVQSAMVQQSILAGEPILENLYGRLGELISDDTNCEIISENKGPSCALKSNRIMRANFLKFVIHKRWGSQFAMDQYTKALSEKDAEAMTVLLGTEFKGRIVKTTEEGPLSLRWHAKHEYLTTPLPSEKDVTEARIQYSIDMVKLVALQEKVAQAILETSATNLSTATRNSLLNAAALK